MQTDPIGYEDQYNLYAYVRNDPINNVDPTGMRCGGPTIGTDEEGNETVSGTDYCDPERPEDDGPGIDVTGRRPSTSPSTALTGVDNGRKPPQSDKSKEEPKPDPVCKFLLENIGSDPVQIITGALGGLIVGERVGKAAGGLAERAMRSGPVIGSVVRSGRTAAIGARAGRIGGAAGAVAGAAAGLYFQRDLENFIDDTCTPGDR